MGRSFIPVNFLFSQRHCQGPFPADRGHRGKCSVISEWHAVTVSWCPLVWRLFLQTRRNKTDCFCSSFRRQSVLLLVFLAPLKRKDPADPQFTPHYSHPPHWDSAVLFPYVCVFAFVYLSLHKLYVCVGWRQTLERVLACAPHFPPFLLHSPWTHLPMSSLKTDYCPFM